MAKKIERIGVYGQKEILFSNGTLVTYFGKKWIVMGANGVLHTTPPFKTEKDAVDYVEKKFPNLK